MSKCTYNRVAGQCHYSTEPGHRYCTYHQGGGKMVEYHYFYSQLHSKWLDSLQFKPDVGDLRVWSSAVSGTDGEPSESSRDLCEWTGKVWRKLCRHCRRTGYDTYCSYHKYGGAKTRSYSLVACECIDTLQKEIKCTIQHIHVEQKEDRISSPKGEEFNVPGTKYKCDGYIQEHKMIVEFLGGYWHGDPVLYRSEDMNFTVKKTFGELHQRTFSRFREIVSQGYKLFYIWEREYNEWKDMNPFQRPLLVHIFKEYTLKS